MGAAVVVLLLLLTVVRAQIDSCGGMNPKSFLAAPFNETVFSCRPMWNNFVLRYYQDQDNVLSIVLSTEYTTGWVGMGFSQDGMMVGSSAMVGWIGNTGTTSASSYPYQLKRTHGALAIFGWGVLLPIGALVARYCKRWDPLWYYLHVAIQLIGFIIGLAAVVAGISLYDKLHADISAHRGLGIFIFVLGILQVMAFFLRPNTDSKIRRYWNWYHHWSGRLALFLAVVNIFLGIHAANAGTSWKVVYGINLAVLLLATIILEVLLWTRWSRKTVTTTTTL